VIVVILCLEVNAEPGNMSYVHPVMTFMIQRVTSRLIHGRLFVVDSYLAIFSVLWCCWILLL